MTLTHLRNSLSTDVRYALRGLKSAPGYTVTLVFTLALGLGATTTMLAIVDSVLVRPVALPYSKQLVMPVREVHGTKDYNFSFRQIHVLNDQSKSFSAVSGYNSMPRPVGTGDGSRIAIVTRVTPNFFRMLDVHARYGRLLTDSDINSPVAVVNFAFWRERLHSDPGAVGSTIKISGGQKTVIGVTPQGIHFPQNLDGPEVYTPILIVPVDPKDRDAEPSDSAWVAARLKPGVSMQQALAEARSLFRHVDEGGAADRGTLLLSAVRIVSDR